MGDCYKAVLKLKIGTWRVYVRYSRMVIFMLKEISIQGQTAGS